MAVMDEYKKERESIKGAPFTKKCEYIWDYYKIHILIVLFIAILVGMFVYSYVMKKEVGFHGAFLNSQAASEQVEEVRDEYMKEMGWDGETYDVFLDNSMYFDYDNPETIDPNLQQKLVTLLLTGELDVIASEGNTMEYLAQNEFFQDMRTVLDKEQIQQYQDQFIYIEGGQEPIPVGIQANKEDRLCRDFMFTGGEAVIAIPVSTDNVEAAVAFIELVVE